MAQRTILIVGDGAAIAREVERHLAALGHHLAAPVVSRHDAAEVASRVSPDVMVVDATSPGDVVGMRTAEELERRIGVPAVLVIAGTDRGGLQWARDTGRHAYVVTPFTERELRANVEVAFGRRDWVRAVRDLEDRFFTVSIDMLCFLDFNGYFKRLNPAWERTLGFTRQELMSKPFIEFVHPDDRERTLNQNREVRGGGRALGFENRYLCKDGSYRWFRWNAAPDLGEHVIYSVARDVTETKQAEEERERLLRELQAALGEVKTLRAILPICSYCRRIRDEHDQWHTVESYVSQHTSSRFSHSICPSCMITQHGGE